MSIEKARKHTGFRAFLLIKTYYLFSAYVNHIVYAAPCNFITAKVLLFLFSPH